MRGITLRASGCLTAKSLFSRKKKKCGEYGKNKYWAKKIWPTLPTRAMQWCLLSPGIGLAVNQASISLSASEKQSNLLSGKVRISPIWSLICFCHPGGPCCFPSWVCSAAKVLVLKQELLPPCPGSSSVGPSGCNAGFVLLLLVHEVGLDMSPEPPKRRVGLRTAPLKAAPSLKKPFRWIRKGQKLQDSCRKSTSKLGPSRALQRSEPLSGAKYKQVLTGVGPGLPLKPAATPLRLQWLSYTPL